MPSRTARRKSEFVKQLGKHEIIGEPRDYFPLRGLAIDIGANMAVAHNLYGTNDVRALHQLFKGGRVERAGATILWLADILDQLIAIQRPDFISYERPFARGHDATRCLWGIAGIIEALGGSRSIPVLDQENKSVKSFVAGNGSATKDDMLLFASITGYPGENEHEADAWCQLRYAEAHISIKPPTPPRHGRQRRTKETT